MGGKQSKCGNCGSVREVIKGGEYNGLCESCARRQHQQAEEELARTRKLNELERQRKSDELEAKRRDAELRYLEEQRRLERENEQQRDEAAMKAERDRLAIQREATMAAFDKEMKNNELHWKETCMKYEELSKDLEQRRKEYTMELEKKAKEQELEIKKQSEEQRLEHEKLREEQSRKQDSEDHLLTLRLKEEQQKFDQAIEQKKTDAQIEIDKEIGARMTMGLEAVAPTGAKMKIRFANDANPALAQLLLQGSGMASLAIQAPLDSQQTTNPEHRARTHQEGDEDEVIPNEVIG